ncbi:hypothetical protein SAY86_028432 [Trapa natans]|uniref:Uncharacterized protein n=1 Tax=Trapa natans TaxID=22666 RepID=A0AAN7LZB4_TRANT|nr:hypothetical protein SAY86_028432 [Trapa natans]
MFILSSSLLFPVQINQYDDYGLIKSAKLPMGNQSPFLSHATNQETPVICGDGLVWKLGNLSLSGGFRYGSLSERQEWDQFQDEWEMLPEA